MGLLRDVTADLAPEFEGDSYATWRAGTCEVTADWSVAGAPVVELDEHTLPVSAARHLARLLLSAADRAEGRA